MPDEKEKEEEAEEEAEEGGDKVEADERNEEEPEEDLTQAQKSLPRQGETPMSENQQSHGKHPSHYTKSFGHK